MITVTLVILLQAILVDLTDFGYSPLDQNDWCREYRQCCGNAQSPIYINSSDVISVNLPNLKFYYPPQQLFLQNNGHTVQLRMTALNGLDVPYICGGILTGKYQFEALHFHWGNQNDRGSEHVLNDIRYPLEMHVVFRNAKYCNLEEALRFQDGLTVLAVFFQLREKPHVPLDMLLKYFPLLENHNTNITMEEQFQLMSLMPFDKQTFYTYRGSLTTPPCSEVVTWIIFPEPILISFYQMKYFRILKNKKNEQMSDNFRYLQAINNREVRLRKSMNRRNNKIRRT